MITFPRELDEPDLVISHITLYCTKLMFYNEVFPRLIFFSPLDFSSPQSDHHLNDSMSSECIFTHSRSHYRTEHSVIDAVSVSIAKCVKHLGVTVFTNQCMLENENIRACFTTAYRGMLDRAYSS